MCPLLLLSVVSSSKKKVRNGARLRLCKCVCKWLTAPAATGVEGIFRLSGSEKRIKELKTTFDSPTRYGKGLVWDGYTVHDAATVLRRYLNDLPEPVVPLDLYEKFREPLRGATKQAVGDAEGPQFVENFDEKHAISKYQQLITELPPLNRQLLLYILDLLAVFAAKSDENRMTSQNLAAIFQPGMLSHPTHAMAPEEYRLNQCVIIFLIENQDHFLIGMQGTAADENTVKEVQSGTPKLPTTPEKREGIQRSDSTASAGADSVRRDGKLRRNRSVSSRHSKQDSVGAPGTPTVATTPTGSLNRSNTVPSKKSPAVGGGKFTKADPASPLPEPMTPVRAEPAAPATTVESTNAEAPEAPKEEAKEEPAATVSKLNEALETSPETSPAPAVPANTGTAATAAKPRALSGMFNRSATDASDKRQPNKLRKKIPGAANMSAQSSTASLTHHSNAVTPLAEASNPMDAAVPVAVAATAAAVAGAGAAATTTATTETAAHAADSTAAHTVESVPTDVAQSREVPADAELSHTEASDLDDAINRSPQKKEKKLWRLSRAVKKDDVPSVAAFSHLGTNEHADASTTSFASSSNKPRKSYQGDGSERPIAEQDESHESGKKEDSKGPIGWIKHKYREAKEKEEQKRAKSPPADRSGLSVLPIGRGKSVDLKRDDAEAAPAVEANVVESAKAAEPVAETTTTPAPVIAAESTPTEPAKTEASSKTDASAAVSPEPTKVEEPVAAAAVPVEASKVSEVPKTT